MAFTPKFPWFPNVDIFFIRFFLMKHMHRSCSFFEGKMLDIGCGVKPYKDLILNNSKTREYIGMDLAASEIYTDTNPEILWDGYNIPLADKAIDSALITEVLEHCPEPVKVLTEVNRVLKPGAPVSFSVPFLWYLHETPWDFYRYTPFALKRIFEESGFELEILETYGSNDLAFLHTYFIWLKKGALPKLIRFAIYLLSLPFILLFLALAKKTSRTEFREGQMYIGTVGIARKKKDVPAQ